MTKPKQHGDTPPNFSIPVRRHSGETIRSPMQAGRPLIAPSRHQRRANQQNEPQRDQREGKRTLADTITDTTPPTISSLTLPGTVNLNATNPVVSFSASATDDVSGVNSVVVFFDKAFSVKDASGNSFTEQGVSSKKC